MFVLQSELLSSRIEIITVSLIAFCELKLNKQTGLLKEIKVQTDRAKKLK